MGKVCTIKLVMNERESSTIDRDHVEFRLSTWSQDCEREGREKFY